MPSPSDVRPVLHPDRGRQGEHSISRRGVLGGATAAGLTLAAGTPAAAAESGYLVGRGISDATGPVADIGMMGYSMPQQRAEGLHQRLWARAFVVADRVTGQRMAWCVVDQAMLPMAVHSAVLDRLDRAHPGLYTLANTSLTATHTHSAPGGCSHYIAYNLAIMGFQRDNFDAFVSGIVEAVLAAHRDLRPGSVLLGRGELRDASVNRSRKAFDLNPATDRDHYPGGIDPQMTVLRLRQGSKDVGAISWFPTHGTSLPNTNLLVSGDNKGYAAYEWEHQPDVPAGFVAAFAQTNSGDMSPNLDLAPGTGPTDDPVENTRIIGERQARAARRIHRGATRPLRGPIDSRACYVDLSDVQVDGRWTPDGAPHRTAPGCIGYSMMAGSTEDGPGIPVPEGTTDPTYPLYRRMAEQPIPAELRQEQQPKAIFMATGPVGATPSVLPLQLIRLGDLYICAGPAEFTIVAGLRIRRAVATELRVPLQNVVMQGYSNGFSQYVTTPEEYDSQQYEGGSTLFGRYTLPAYEQEFTRIARSMRTGSDLVDPGPASDPPTARANLAPGPGHDGTAAGVTFGQVLVAPRPRYGKGETVTVEFAAGHPKHDLRRNSSYLQVQRRVGGAWRSWLDDDDWETTYRWRRTDPVSGASTASVQWRVGPDTPSGQYRIQVVGTALPLLGARVSYVGTSEAFTVS